MVFLLMGSLAHGEPIELRVSDEDRELAVRLIPSLDDGVVRRGDKTALGGEALTARAGGGDWSLHHLDILKGKKEGERWVLAWLYRAGEEGDPTGFLCPECEAFGVMAFVRGDKVVAMARRPLTMTHTETIEYSREVKAGKKELVELVRRHRLKGEVSDVAGYFKRNRKRLTEMGSIPLRAGNEGACGSLAFIYEKKRILSSRERCKFVWRFEAELEPGRRGILVREKLVSAKAKRKRFRKKKKKVLFFQPKERKRMVLYRVGKSRLRASRTSLRHVH